MKKWKRANGTGTICKLAGNRRRPFAVKITLGYTEEGRLIYKYVSYHKTYREAERALADFNRDPFMPSSITLKELYDEFIAEQERTKASTTILNHQAAIKKLEPLWNMRLQEIDRLELQRFFIGLDATPSVIINIQRTMKGIIRLAVKKGIMPVTMLDVMKVVEATPTKEGKKCTHTLITKEERQALWKRQNEDKVRIILFYIYTGLRYKELYDLMPEDIHDDYIEIKQSKTEAGKRIVPLGNIAKSLMPLPAIPGYSYYNQLFHEVMPDHTPHDTRHTFVTMLTEIGEDERVIQSIVGHARKKTVTDIYTHITLERKLEAVNKIIV